MSTLRVTLATGELHELPFETASSTLTVQTGLDTYAFAEVAELELDHSPQRAETKAELIEMAEGLGIEVPSKATKAEVEELLAAHEAATGA